MARPEWSAWWKLLARHAALTAGGGGVTTVALERDLLERGWLERETFRTYYGLARLTPGTVLLALVTAIGWHFFRWRGAGVALVTASLPGSVLAACLTEGQALAMRSDWGRAFFAGTAAAVCGLLAASIWRVVAPYLDPVRRWSSVGVLALAASAAWLGWPPFLVIVGTGVLGFVVAGGGEES